MSTQAKKRFRMPDTYIIIFGIVIVSWLLTFVIPAGKYTTNEMTYDAGNNNTITRTVLEPGSFRYMHPIDQPALASHLKDLANDDKALLELEADPEGLETILASGQDLTLDQLEEVGIEESELYQLYGDDIYDTSVRLNKTARIWGTEATGGFGFLNYLFEGLVTGDRGGSAIGIVALLLVVGGSFGMIMKTGAIDAGIYAFVGSATNLKKLALPMIFIGFSFAGATFGASEQVIPFVLIIAPFCVALGYDSITAVTVTFAASQIGNATSWMSPFSIAIAQGIAGLPALSGAGYRILLWVIITLLAAGFTMIYAERVKANPESSASYHSDAYFRDELEGKDMDNVEFKLGHKVILLELLLGLVWIVLGVMKLGYSIPELASQFFVMGLASGITALAFGLNDLTVNDLAYAFKEGVSDLAPTAVVVGMAKGILLVLGGSDAGTFSALNTILYSVGNLLEGIPTFLGAWAMYIFQSLFNLVITSNSGQAALTMPIMAPLADIIGVSRQVAVLAFQLGSGFVDAFTPVSASLIGCLAAARLDWVDWAKFQGKMQIFLFILGSLAIFAAIAFGYR
ncbi:putative basic amino acid antiporter YfcC [Hutsoniella sourekii]|uniref:putative basic amino acid antiporter YfcC n=1 Tax=Hutsoniella sourekii TaxID=87650 RepID=UPI00048047EC|nr:putative basic amino acid antiporter YfcC [Hutsoniella sourekii]